MRVSATMALLFIVLTATTSLARDKWTQEDMNRQLLYTTLHMIDWGQTRYIARHPESYREFNPILGDHPSTSEVDMYATVTLAASWLIAYKLNKKNRKIFQWFIIGAESYCVGLNFSVGIGFRW